MSRVLRAVLLSLVASVVAMPAAAQNDERILDFHSDIAVQKDSSLLVHEAIRVRSSGEQIKHGIYRDFPTQYRDRLGHQYAVRFDLRKVTRDQQLEFYDVSDIANGVRIRIGNASAVLAPGEYTYELTYSVKREIGFFENNDELYWNVTGNGWVFPIDHASATVMLPSPGGKVTLAGYTGAKGARGADFEATPESDTNIHFATTRPLAPGEGITIVVDFPKGLVSLPAAGDRVFWFLEDNAAALVGLIGLIAVCAYYFMTWMKVARDPKRGTLVVRYEPPKDLSPAAVRFLKHRHYDDRAFTSAIVSLGVKRQLSIEEAAGGYTLTHTDGQAAQLPPDEARVLSNLFSGGTTVTVGSTQSLPVTAAVATLKSDLAKAEAGLIRGNGKAMVPGVIMSLLTFGAMLLGIPDVNNSRGGAAMIAIFVCVWPFGIAAFVRQARTAQKAHKSSTSSWTGALIFLLTFVGILALFVWMTNLAVAVILAALVTANAIFNAIRRTLTPAGGALMDEIDGFQQFLVEVESDRIQRMNPPDKTPQLFERCLAYALALGVEERWAQQFAGVLAQAAAADGGRTTTGYTPEWYVGSGLTSFDAGSFASSLSGGLSSALSTAATPPGSSSGSGGGGSSGGGGGGGGGGGW